MEQRLIDANKLNRKDLNCANVPMNFIDIAPTVLTIPENPTNGDVIKALFPNKSDFNGGNGVFFKKSWWNAPYKAESVNK